MKHYLQVKLHPFLTSALDGGERSTSCPAILRPVRTPVPIKQEAGWAPEPICTLCRRDCPCGNRTPERQACGTATAGDSTS